MNMKRCLATIVLGVVIAVSATAQSNIVYTGQLLEQAWQRYQRAENYPDQTYTSPTEAAKDLLSDGEYQGFIAGVMDANLDKVDVPVGVTVAQLNAIVGSYLDNHAELWNMSAVVLVIQSLKAAFPARSERYEFAWSGNTLDKYWQAAKPLIILDLEGNVIQNSDWSLYHGYVAGVISSDIEKFLPPPTTNDTPFLAVVGNYLDDHPEQWNQPAAILVIEALQQAFPKSGG